MDVLAIFESNGKKEFFLDEEQMLWLNGTMLCKRLGFSNPSKSIPLHVEECDRQKVDVDALHPAWFVNEPGTWSMILAAKTVEAKDFKRELTTKILPSIRKTGGYIKSDITPEELRSLFRGLTFDQRKTLVQENWQWLQDAVKAGDVELTESLLVFSGTRLSDHDKQLIRESRSLPRIGISAPIPG